MPVTIIPGADASIPVVLDGYPLSSLIQRVRQVSRVERNSFMLQSAGQGPSLTAQEMLERVRATIPTSGQPHRIAQATGQGLTALQMVTRVRNVIRDPSGSWITDAMILDLLNDAFLDLAWRTLSLIADFNSTTADNTGKVTVPNDFIAVASMTLSGKPVQWVDESTWEDYDSLGGTPNYTLGRYYASVIQLYPKPAAATPYALRYYQRPPILAASDGTKLGVPPQHEIRAINYARSHSLTVKREFDAADRYMTMYESGLPPGIAQQFIPEELQEKDEKEVTDEEIFDYLNEALLQLAWETRTYRKSASGNITAGTSFAIPADLIDAFSIFVNNKVAQFPCDDEEWNDWVNTGQIPPRTLVRLNGPNFEVYPAQANPTPYFLRYSAMPSILVAGADKVEIPVPMQSKAISWAKAMSFLKVGTKDQYDAMLAEFYRGLRPGIGATPQDTDYKDEPYPRPIYDYMIVDWLNEAQVDMAWRTLINRSRITGTCTGAVAAIPLPLDYHKVLTLRFVNPTGLSSQVVGSSDGLNVSDQQFFDWTDAAAAPPAPYYRIFNGQIEVYPTQPASVVYVLEYVQRPAKMTAGTDKPQIPAELQPALVDYARGHLKLVEGDTKLADYYFGVYASNLPEPGDIMERLIPKDLEISLDDTFGPFDLDPNARHI